MILTTRCAGCGRRGAVLCRTCRFSLIARPSVTPPGDVVVASAYAGRVRDILLGCKYHNRRTVTRHLAGVLVRRLLADAGPAVDGVDVVTWAPTTPARRRHRGFDQSELIARAVAAKLGVPCRRLLEREGSGSTQTGSGRLRRLDPATGPSFRAHPRTRGARVLVVDDVVTTGGTLQAATTSLRDAGAADVTSAAVAATPSRLLAGRKVA